MDSWQQDWAKFLETVATEVEQFFQIVADDMAIATNALLEFSDELIEQVQTVIAPDMDKVDEQVEQWIEPMLQAVLAIENTFSQVTEPVTQTVEPILNEHLVCSGCRHYHGHTYNEVMLVCAMHPYGVGEGVDICPDKEPVVWLPHVHSFDDNDSFR